MTALPLGMVKSGVKIKAILWTGGHAFILENIGARDCKKNYPNSISLVLRDLITRN